MGDDFAFKRPIAYFKFFGKLIRYINNFPERFKMKLQFATPSDYFNAIESNIYHFFLKKKSLIYFLLFHLIHLFIYFSGSQVKFSSLSKDFLPYRHEFLGDWTGFYSNRPLMKYTIRKADSLLRATEILFSFSLLFYQKQFVPEVDQVLFFFFFPFFFRIFIQNFYSKKNFFFLDTFFLKSWLFR